MRHLIAVLVFVLPIIGLGQQLPRITAVNLPDSIDTESFFSFFIEIHDSRGLPENLNAQLELPENWKIVNSREILREPVRVRNLYTVQNGFQLTGNYPIRFRFRDSFGQSHIKQFLVFVRKKQDIVLFSESVPQFMKVGDTLDVDLQVLNRGNGTEVIDLQTNFPDAEISSHSLKLAPFEKETVHIRKPIFPISSSYESMNLTVRAETKSNLNKVHSTNVLVFDSRKKNKVDDRLRFPIYFGGRYNYYTDSQNKQNAYQLLAGGQGFLDRRENNWLSFTLRGPNTIEFPALGLYDLYQLNYRYKKQTELYAGDFQLRFTRLLSQNRFGRGAYISQEFGPVGLKAFYLKPRFYAPSKENYGGQFSYAFNPLFRVSTSYFHKSLIREGQSSAHEIVNLGTAYTGKNLEFDFEVAGDNRVEKESLGTFGTLSFSPKRFRFQQTFIFAGRDFNGFYTNSRFLNSSLNYQLSKAFSIGFNGYYSRLNPNFDILSFQNSPESKSYMLFFNFVPSPKHNILINLSRQDKKDVAAFQQYNYSENYAMLMYRLQLRRFSLTAQQRLGQLTNRLTENRFNQAQISYSSWLQPEFSFGAFSLGGFFNYENSSRFSQISERQKMYFYGGNIGFHPSESFDFRASYRNNFAPDELFRQRTLLNASLRYKTRFHEFIAQANSFILPYGNLQNIAYFSVSYILHLYPKLKSSKGLSHISGNLIGNNPNEVANKIIQLNDRLYLTDKNGHFEFRDIEPAKYTLNVRQDMLASEGLITQKNLPQDIDLQPNQDYIVDVEIQKASRIDGQIVLQNVPENSRTPRVLIRLSNKQEQYLAEMNINQAFKFNNIVPGAYTLEAFLPDQDPDWILENNIQLLNIERESEIKVQFILKKRERQVQFSNKVFQLNTKKRK
ncbi:hypothetical protein LAG90_11665 [Marinilongibacter aquaticus]|uniref:hypothetical protein n=1 Tax=Marinilongibacter aquaticus TaxID=2975157 RepID=UPI0021BDB3DB|nr:hypothetical protein [Marinilongibacter aquaticus]UBM57476.1 hypothetical protein LAG90_11665 [Marinilongibacter aquaticus]